MKRVPTFLVASILTFGTWVVAMPASASFPGAPDEIAYTVVTNGHGAIYATPPVEVAPHVLVDLGDRSASQAAWGPEGQWLAFTGEVSPGGATAIFVSDADGSNIHEVTFPSDGEADSDASWSPSGDQIVFARRLESGRTALLKVDVSMLTIDALPLPSWVYSASEPAWSPGGSTIAFVARQTDESPCGSSACRWSLYVVDSIGGEPRLIDGGVDHHDPEWSPDGTRIIAGVGVDTDPTFSLGVVFRVDSGGTAFTLADSSNFSPSWSPEGDEILVQFGSTRSSIVSYDTNGRFVRFVVEGAEPAWRSVPDTVGPTIVFHPSVSYGGWLGGPYGAYVGILAKDGATVASLSCTVDGEPNAFFQPQPGLNGSMEGLVYFTTSGVQVLSCAATDGLGNISSRAETFQVDITPPSIDFDPAPSTNGWLGGANSAHVGVHAEDRATVNSLLCRIDGEWIPSFRAEPGPNGSMEGLVFFTTDGVHFLRCTATDGLGNESSRGQTFQIDLAPPSVGLPSMTPPAVRVGEVSSISVVASDGGSGLESASYLGQGLTGGSISGVMHLIGSGFTATLDLPDRPELWTASVDVADKMGLHASSQPTLFASYDPDAGSIGGTGWIVPGGETSEAGDRLTGLDGTSKASFGFSARYRSSSSSLPSGTLTFSYGSKFKLQSKDFAWLVVLNTQNAYLSGVATIQGVDGTSPFILQIGDGGGTAQDTLVLRVFSPGANLAIDAPAYQASGAASGQITIQR